MRFIDTTTLSNTRITHDGYLVAEVRCARTGCQTYLGSEVGLTDTDPINVYRPEEAVFHKDSLATYSGKPVTRGHPPEAVTSENWKKYAVGDIGEDIARDGEFVRVPMKIMDQETIDAIQAGEREISMGYTTPIEMKDGIAPDGTPYQAVQTGPIRINHLAVVPVARGGSELRIDSDASSWGTAPQPTEQENNMNLRTIVVDGLSIQVTDQGAQAIDKLQSVVADRDSTIENLQTELADTKKDLETKDGELTAVKKQLEDANSPAAITDAVRKRASLLDAAEKKGKKKREEYEEMDDAAIRRAVVSENLGDVAKDMSDDAISGAFAALGETKTTTQNDSMQIQTNDADPWGAFTNQKEAS